MIFDYSIFKDITDSKSPVLSQQGLFSHQYHTGLIIIV